MRRSFCALTNAFGGARSGPERWSVLYNVPAAVEKIHPRELCRKRPLQATPALGVFERAEMVRWTPYMGVRKDNAVIKVRFLCINEGLNPMGHIGAHILFWILIIVIIFHILAYICTSSYLPV